MADEEELLRRLQAKDASLWAPGNVSSTRLGWLEVPREMERAAKDLHSWAASIDEDTIILLGMGGSSLGPLVLDSLAHAFGSAQRRILVCDTTEPSTVASMPFEDAFVVVSSKSGTTLEPNVLFDYARTRQKDLRKYAVITDESTPLANLAARLRVRRVFHNRGDIGGRYSVLSYFGLVPAALLGYDIAELCGRALEIDRLEAVRLGLALGQHARDGQDKATFVLDASQRSFGLWVEQLLAESTGKQGKAVIPIPTSEPESGADRQVYEVALQEAAEVAAQFFRFEIATAIAGHVLGIDPFDEPNVAESKANTNRVLADLPLPESYAAPVGEVNGFFEESIRTGDYISIQAYLPFGIDEQLERLRCKLRDENGGIAVSAGYGPRFLHSTGQMHKGGPASVVALQIVAKTRESLAIPDKSYDFGTLIDAQAIGDYQSLLNHDRMVLRVAVDRIEELL